jgi:uncharacterized protein DUF4440
MLRSVLLVLTFCPLAAEAQVPGQRPTADPSQSHDSATIAGLEQRIEAAVVRRDAALLDSVYASTFRFTHSTGNVQTRAQLLASLRAPQAPDAPGRTISRDIDSVEVDVHGNVALTTGRIHVVRQRGDYTIRYARIYARSATAAPWMLITHHSTGETPGAPPGLGGVKP